MSETKQPWWKADPTTPVSDLVAKHGASQPRIVPAWQVLAQGLTCVGFSKVVHTEPEAEVIAEKALKDGIANVTITGLLFGGTGRKEEEPPTVFIQACYALETLDGLALIGEPSFALRVRLKDGGGLVVVPGKEAVT